tara:strand:- start:172 stop:507 length:336 start_codon:yes stop_codon:yes gene_type:complete
VNWYLGPLRKYAEFSGRAGRKEYWFFTLWQTGIFLVLAVLTGPIYSIYFLATLLPGISVGVRRLHDINLSGGLMFIGLIPVIGWIILLVLAAQEGTKGPNDYGAEPIEAAS